MADDMQEYIREFLTESSENLATLDRELMRLESDPTDAAGIASVFRTVHTIKGTCGFFSFDTLGAVAHAAENLLCQVRDGHRPLTPALISLILEAADKIKLLLLQIEQTGSEGEADASRLIARLEHAHAACAPAPGSVHTLAAHAAPTPETAAPPPQAEAQTPAQTPAQPAAQTAPPHTDLPAAAETSASASHPSSVPDATIRVDVGLLDRLVNLTGELVLARNQLLPYTGSADTTLGKAAQRLNLITSELQESVIKARMQPLSVVWSKLPRVVRDLAVRCGKRVQLEMSGASTELDKTILEAIKDPLTHIVRNSCDHGIETPEVRLQKGKPPFGTLHLRAFHEAGVVNIEITDDGAGIEPRKIRFKAVEKGLLRPEQAAVLDDREARQLIFMPGFSTAATVTSLSGRGVGMDVVRTNIERIGGTVEVLDRLPYGTTLRIRIPLTLAIVPGLLVSVEAGTGTEAHRFLIPQANLLELVRLEGASDLERIRTLHGTSLFQHRGKLLPLLALGDILGVAAGVQVPGHDQPGQHDQPGSGRPPMHRRDIVNLVVLQTETCAMALAVDGIHDTQEIVVKPIGRQLKSLGCYAGAAVMGDGLPALILDVTGLAKLAGLGVKPSLQQNADEVIQQAVLQARSAVTAASEPASEMLLLFSSSGFERLAVPLASVARLEVIATGRFERAAGRTVVHYRGEILPLVSLARLLEPGLPTGPLHPEFPHAYTLVIIFERGSSRVGLVVGSILDIVEEPLRVRCMNTQPGLLGSALIAGRITELLDLDAVFAAIGEAASPPTGEAVTPCSEQREAEAACEHTGNGAVLRGVAA